LPDVVVRVLLGAKWVEAAPIVAYLGIAMLYQPFSLAAGPLLISQKRSRALAKYSMLAGVLTVVSFVVALPFGPAMVAASYAISGAVIRVPILCRIIGRSGPVTERDQYYAFFTSLWAGGFLAAGYWGLRMVPQLGEHPLYLLIAAALITAPVMLGSLWILPSGRTAIRDAFALLKLLH
jgi:O-antigen/teichoic acid export membrane protein